MTALAPPTSGREARLPQLDALRALAILLVVAIHARAYSGIAGGPEWFWFLVEDAGVPVFFLVDGFLFAARRDRAFDYTSHVAASARRLLVPWIVFGTFYLAVRAAAEAAAIVPDRIVLGDTWMGIAGCLYLSCAALQLYFLVSLFLIRCLAPLTRRLIAAPRWVLLVSIPVAAALHSAYRWWIGDIPGEPILLGLWGLQFHLLGAALVPAAPWIRRRRFPIVAVLSVSMFALRGLPVPASEVAQYAYLIALFALFWGVANPGRILPRIGRETMGIYLLHAPILMKAVSVLTAAIVLDSALRFAVVTLASFALAFAASLLLVRLPFGAIALGDFPVRRA